MCGVTFLQLMYISCEFLQLTNFKSTDAVMHNIKLMVIIDQCQHTVIKMNIIFLYAVFIPYLSHRHLDLLTDNLGK